MSRTAGKTGLLLPYESPVGIGGIEHYAANGLTPGPASVDYYKGIQYPLACNGTIGDCTIAGLEHVDQQDAHIVGEPWTYVGDPATQSAYFHLTGGQDTGLPLSLVVATASLAPGLVGANVVGAATVNTQDVETIKSCIATFGAVYTAGNLPQSAEAQFADGDAPWSVVPGSPIVGGHCFPLVGYTGQGPVGCTWADTVQIEWDWWTTYGTQCYVLLTKRFKDAGKGPDLDWGALYADLSTLTCHTLSTPWYTRLARWIEREI